MRTGPHDETVSGRNTALLEELAGYDAIVVAGQAKSHCVAWSIEDLVAAVPPAKLQLLEDCTSPVVVPGVVDYTEEANAAVRRFAEAGMHVVISTSPMASWPGLDRRD